MITRKIVDRIQSRDDLVKFIEGLVSDLHTQPDDWENPSLDRYLSAMARWLNDSDSFYKNQGSIPPATPEWKTIAEILAAARIYE